MLKVFYISVHKGILLYSFHLKVQICMAVRSEASTWNFLCLRIISLKCMMGNKVSIIIMQEITHAVSKTKQKHLTVLCLSWL